MDNAPHFQARSVAVAQYGNHLYSVKETSVITWISSKLSKQLRTIMMHLTKVLGDLMLVVELVERIDHLLRNGTAVKTL